jgi:hypothetical protein
MGEFQFGYFHSFINCRYSEKKGNKAFEFSWEGNDEMDSAPGRGFVIIIDGEIYGYLFSHKGDESGF